LICIAVPYHVITHVIWHRNTKAGTGLALE
jgi:hypothetical protein